MLINEFSFSKFLPLLSIPITPILFKTLIVAIILFILLNVVALDQKKSRAIILILFLLTFIYYFGLVPFLEILIILAGAVLLGSKLLLYKDFTSSLITGLFLFLEIYIVIALTSNFKVALTFLIIFSFFLFMYKLNRNYDLFLKFSLDINNFIRKFNIIDYWLIGLSFTISSQPQSHWDAVHANLYNAKWYIINNSFNPLTESISSLFPQNAIGYYSLFFQIGREKMLQIAYLFPLILLILLLKNISTKLNFPKFANYLWYLILFTPIVIFQASNGYYDLLVTLIIVAAFYILFFQDKKDSIINTLSASFLIGFGAAIKYFPLVLMFLPIIIYSLNQKDKKLLLLISTICIIISLFPLVIWMSRSYLYTGSPTFPFFQSIFHTPKFWSGSELTENFMIQTPMNMLTWIKGGFIQYPILTYFRTESYIEATRGYPGLIYIFILPLQLIILINIIKKLNMRSMDKIDYLYLYLLCGYFIVGLISRYYRYIWPFQLVLTIVTLVYLKNIFKEIKNNLILTILIFVILFININNVLGYFRFFPITPEKLFQPDYYSSLKNISDPIAFLNKVSNSNTIILDTSKFILPRVNFVSKTYECNWYWINGVNEFTKAEENRIFAVKLIKRFKYIITSNPISDSQDFCHNIVEKNADLLKKVYSDSNYFIFKVN